jgi:hypothetical protein
LTALPLLLTTVRPVPTQRSSGVVSISVIVTVSLGPTVTCLASPGSAWPFFMTTRLKPSEYSKLSMITESGLSLK